MCQVVESDAQHEVTDCKVIPIHNLPPMYALTSTGRVVPMRSALEVFEIHEIIKDKKVRDGRVSGQMDAFATADVGR
jgi:hypothetical protein